MCPQCFLYGYASEGPPSSLLRHCYGAGTLSVGAVVLLDIAINLAIQLVTTST